MPWSFPFNLFGSDATSTLDPIKDVQFMLSSWFRQLDTMDGLNSKNVTLIRNHREDISPKNQIKIYDADLEKQITPPTVVDEKGQKTTAKDTKPKDDKAYIQQYIDRFGLSWNRLVALNNLRKQNGNTWNENLFRYICQENRSLIALMKDAILSIINEVDKLVKSSTAAETILESLIKMFTHSTTTMQIFNDPERDRQIYSILHTRIDATRDLFEKYRDLVEKMRINLENVIKPHEVAPTSNSLAPTPAFPTDLNPNASLKLTSLAKKS